MYRELDDEQSSQSPFVCVASAVGLSPLSHLLMEMLNEYIYIKINVSPNRTPRGCIYNRPGQPRTQRREREKERKMIDFYVCALSPFLSFFSGERGRAIRSRIIFDDFPVPYLFLPFRSKKTPPTQPNPTSSSTTTFFSTSVHPHTHKVTLEIDKNRQDPVQPVCVCMTTTAISLFCLPVCVYLLMHIISSSSSCFSSSSSFLVCLIQLLLSLVVVVVVVFLFFVCWLVMLDFYISL